MAELRALLDNPDPKSLGLVPIVLSDAGGGIRVSGYAEASNHRAISLDHAGLEDLVRAKSALRVDRDIPNETPPNAAALWIGSDFADGASQVGVPLPPLPTHLLQIPGGQLSVGPPDELFVYLDRWVGAAFDRFKTTDNPALRRRLAALMHWALPSDMRTLAASWQSAAKASDEMRMQLRVFAQGVRLGQWRRELQTVLSAPGNPLSNVRVVLFTGPTGSMRHAVFQEFINQAQRYPRPLATASFRNVVVEKARSVRPEGDLDKDLLMKVGQRVVDSSPLFVALSVEDLAKRAEETTLILDSVRHKSVLDAIKWLFKSEVTAIGVHAAQRDIHRRLAEEHYAEGQILQDPTEIEIPELVEQAKYRVDTTTGENWQGEVARISREVFA